MNKLKIFLGVAIVLSIGACSSLMNNYQLQKDLGIILVDSNATLNTIALFYNLKELSNNKIIFGHHHSTGYGIEWSEEENRSDVKDVTGVHPGLIGWDFADLEEGPPITPSQLKKLVPEAHNRGIVNIFAWHLRNIVTGNSFYDTTIVVKHILPGGSHHNVYKRELDKIAQFAKTAIGNDGNIIPLIFRPFHEFDGSWFWWGKNFCSAEEFIELWRFTVDYLRDFKKVRNFIYAFSQDRNFNNEDEFLERYPGDEYVDLMGMDNYWDFTPGGEGLEAISKKLIILSNLAKKRNKIAAFTETGSEKIPNPEWWTQELLKVMDHDSIDISFVMVWRNAHLNHFYAPFKGHNSTDDFIEFKNNPKIIFADELPDLFNIDMNLSN